MANSTEEIFLVPEEWDGKRLDQFIASQTSSWSRGAIQRFIQQTQVWINEIAAVKPSASVRSGDSVRVQPTFKPDRPEAEEGELTILYEDADVMVINKPSNLTVHPTDQRTTGTLVNRLLFHSKEIADAVYDTDSLISRMRPGIVHRLDRETSGVLVIAKTRDALLALSEQFKQHTVEKYYTALVYGRLDEPTTVRKNIRRKPAGYNLMGISLNNDQGKEAVTHIEPLEHFTYNGEELTLVRCRIETGRTHQIRVHCKYLSHTVIGDPLYTNRPSTKLSESLGLSRQFLHATELVFHQPTTNEVLRVSAPLPSDLEAILTKLKRT